MFQQIRIARLPIILIFIDLAVSDLSVIADTPLVLVKQPDSIALWFC